MGKRIIVVATGVLTALGTLTACGGKSSSNSPRSTEATADSAAAVETTAATTATREDFAEYCAKVKGYNEHAVATESALKSNDPKQIRTTFEAIRDAMHDLDKDAPEAVAADVHTMRTFADKLVGAFEKYGFDVNKLSAAPEFAELSKEMDGGSMTQAGDRLDAWGVGVCGFPPETASGS